MSTGVPTTLTNAERRRLLTLARSAAQQFLDGHATIEPPTLEPAAGRYGGCFVTLRAGGSLRGCRGMIRAIDDLDAAVSCAAGLAACDPRFAHEPVTARELGQIEIEISILSPPQRAADPLSLVPGVHGVLIRRGSRSGCFLPHVAAESNWDAAECLAMCCRMKAGLPADAWRDPRTQVQLFTAEAFCDSEPPRNPD